MVKPPPRTGDVLPGMNAGASTSAVPSPIEGSGTAWVLLGAWALSPARPTPIHPRHECRGFSALLVTNPDELEALEREIRQRTDRLGSLLVGYHMQQALDSVALQAEQEQLVNHWPHPLKNDGKGRVMIRTAQGLAVPVRVTYYRRKGQRRAGKRSAGAYAGLVLLGIYDRCTPALASAVSLLAAMLGSLDEQQDVLAARGVELDTKTVRLIAYRYAARARLVQQAENTAFEDTVAGRRVVISSDGGRMRLREIKRGPKTTKGRRRYTGAWREPKVLIVYVVDAE